MLLCSCGSENTTSGVKVEEPVIMGATTFDNYALVLQLYEGEYQSDFSVGPNFGVNWTGNYQLAIINRSDNIVINTYELEEWSEISISSQDMSPALKVDGEVVNYSIYDNSTGSTITKEIKLTMLALD